MVRYDVLLDTGPLVAVIDSTDQWHDEALRAWPDLLARCVTTEAVVTEASHLMTRGRHQAWAPLDFVIAAQIPVLSLDTRAHERAARLMRQYHDLPMDYADASLVVLAESLGVSNVFTFDRRGFSTYQPAGATTFTVVPQPALRR